MASSGSAVFLVDGKRQSFRFIVSVEHGRMKIWLEDRESKKQWEVKDLTVKSFVTSETTIPQAKLTDYRDRFVERLHATNKEIAEEPRCQLSQPEKDGSRMLTITVDLQLSTFAAKLKYAFALMAVPLDAVDIVDAKVRDMGDEMAVMKENMESHLGMDGLYYGHFKAVQNTGSGGDLTWQLDSNTAIPSVKPKFTVTPKVTVTIPDSGLYMIVVSVAASYNGNYADHVNVLVNDECVQSCRSMMYRDGEHWMHATLVRPMVAGDLVKVKNMGHYAVLATSTMTITQLR